MMALWEVGPPPAVQKPRTKRRIQPGGVGGRQVFGQQDDRCRGHERPLLDAVGQETQHPAADIAQVDGPAGDQRVVDLLQLGYPFLDRLLPRPSGAGAGLDLCLDRLHQLGIIQEFGMRQEDRRLAGPRPLL